MPDGTIIHSDFLSLAGPPVTLHPISLGRGSGLLVSAVPSSNAVSVSWASGVDSVSMTVDSGTTLRTGVDDREMTLRKVTRIQFTVASGTLYSVFDFTNPFPFIEAAQIESVSFWRDVPERGDGVRISTIIDGRVTFESLEGRVVSLGAGEPLLVGAFDGTVRMLRVVNGKVDAQFDGNASGLALGHGPQTRSLMPTLFDQAAATPWIRILVASLGALAGVIIKRRGS
jgi:hypothetical protein